MPPTQSPAAAIATRISPAEAPSPALEPAFGTAGAAAPLGDALLTGTDPEAGAVDPAPEGAESAGPLQPGGSGPAGAGCGPYRWGAVAPRSASQAASNPVTSRPIAAENASSSVRPAAYERMSEARRALP